MIAYLKDGSFPDDRAKVQKLLHLATRYTLFGDVLYKKSCSKLHVDPYLRCLRPDEAQRVMQEVHDGDCENHLGDRSLAHKVISQGCYWPKMFDDVKDYMKKMLGVSEIRPIIIQIEFRPPYLAMSLALHAMGIGCS